MKTHTNTHTHSLHGFSFSSLHCIRQFWGNAGAVVVHHNSFTGVSLPGKEDLNFRHCHGGVVVFLIQKRENNKPPPPLSAFIINNGFYIRSWEENHNSSGDYKKPVAAASWPAMAAHKPVEWVQAVINRFDDQVRSFVNDIMPLWFVWYITLCMLLNIWHPWRLLVVGI